MKKSLLFVAGITSLVSCSKDQQDVIINEPSKVVFSIENELGFDVQTRATAVTELSSFNVLTEKTVSQTQVWYVPAYKNGSSYTTEKYWPSVDTKYAFYASNIDLTYAASGTTVSPTDNDKDVVVAYSPYKENNYRQSVALTFDHIYARIGEVVVNAPASYSIRVASITTKISKGGTYDVKNSTWSSKSALVAQTIAEGNNDIYAVPATYDVTVNYTLSKGDYVKEFTKTGSITLTQGKINKITATPSLSEEEGATEIVFSVSLTPWGADNHSITLN